MKKLYEESPTQCDRCGKHSDNLTPHFLNQYSDYNSYMPPITIKLCPECYATQQEENQELMQPIGVAVYITIAMLTVAIIAALNYFLECITPK